MKDFPLIFNNQLIERNVHVHFQIYSLFNIQSIIIFLTKFYKLNGCISIENTPKSLTVSNCVFSEIVSSSLEKAIKINCINEASSLSVYASDFSLCESNNGTIISSIILNKETSPNALENVLIHDIENIEQGQTIRLKDGVVFFHSVNVSRVYQLTDIFYVDSGNDDQMMFIQITNCYVQRHGFMVIRQNKHHINLCSVVNNTMEGLGSEKFGAVYCYNGTAILKNSNFIGDCPKSKVFFQALSGSITLIDCYANKEITNGVVQFEKKLSSPKLIVFPDIDPPLISSRASKCKNVKLRILHIFIFLN